MPSSSGISMSSTATSGLMRSSWLTASSPVRSDAATTMSGSEATQREISPLITTESSTTITRSGSCRDDIFVERFHDVFVGARMKRARDVGDIVLGGAEHHLGRIAAGQAAQIAEELVAVHHRHVPVKQDRL